MFIASNCNGYINVFENSGVPANQNDYLYIFDPYGNNVSISHSEVSNGGGGGQGLFNISTSLSAMVPSGYYVALEGGPFGCNFMATQ